MQGWDGGHQLYSRSLHDHLSVPTRPAVGVHLHPGPLSGRSRLAVDSIPIHCQPVFLLHIAAFCPNTFDDRDVAPCMLEMCAPNGFGRQSGVQQACFLTYKRKVSLKANFFFLFDCTRFLSVGSNGASWRKQEEEGSTGGRGQTRRA